MFSTRSSTWNVFLFFLICCDLVVGLYEGDQCSLQEGGYGTCRFVSHCPEARKLLMTGRKPQTCGFEGSRSIVCCAGGGVGEISTTSITPASTQDQTTTQKHIQSDVTNRVAGTISRLKCIEYGEYAYDRSVADTLPLFPQRVNVLECVYEKIPLIAGGHLATDQEFPHMAQIGYNQHGEIKWGCGGSIISKNFILTAAHCGKSQLGPATLVRVGLTNLLDTTHMQERTVAEIIEHPQYTKNKYHDIGLLRLSSDLDLDNFARPACLQTERKVPYQKAIASGWGNLGYSDKASDKLLKIVLEFYTEKKCNYTYKREIFEGKLSHGIDDDLMICAGSTADIQDTCEGDSGGPLQVYHDESSVKCMYDIVGITSFGKPCGIAKDVPGVYIRVSTYIKWIEDIVWPN